MRIHDSRSRRLIVLGAFAIAVTVTPTVAAIADQNPSMNIPMAACPPGEHEDIYTNVCVPMLVPRGVAGAGPSLQEQEQDVLDTPGIDMPNVGGTTVP